MNRTCKVCEETKELSEFSNATGCKHGKGWKCKSCKNKENRLAYNTRSEDWFAKPNEKCCRKCQLVKPANEFNVSLNNRSRLSTLCKVCMRNRELVKRRSGDWGGSNRAWASLKYSAKARMLEFGVDKDSFMLWWSASDVCYYCGCSINEYRANRNAVLSLPAHRFYEMLRNPNHAKLNSFSIDRKDPRIGYVLANMAKSCWFCNYIKGGILLENQMLLIAKEIRDELHALPRSSTWPYKLEG